MSHRGKLSVLWIFGSAATGLWMASCVQVENRLISAGMSAAAKDQIMLVRKEPPSFGFQRLTQQAGVFTDLKLFLSKHGLPDFLAETNNRDRRYFILYYLKERHAFVCRSRVENSRAVEFAGPYPITAREFHLLDDFRRDPDHPPAKR